jgi:drug/metabolite transporter (DMT)-like permease
LLGVFSAGLLLGLHWILFFRSIALGGVAVGLITYASAAGVIVLLEVLLGWARLSAARLLAPALSVAGVYVIAPSSDNSDLSMPEGLLFGLLSALVYAFMIVLGKGLMTRGALKPLAYLSGQLVGAVLVGIPVVVWQGIPPIGLHDLGIVVLLGVLCSAIGGGLFNRALVVVRSGTAAVITNMEAPYGVFLAWLLVGEQISVQTLFGVGLVTAAAILAARADVGK